MSAVIKQAKQHYGRAIKVEMAVLAVLTLVLASWKGAECVSFLAGGLVSFVPYCVFAYWIFFRNTAKDATKMTAFYRGEAIKWAITILLFVGGLKWIPDLHLGLFFAGYMVGLVLNNAVPFVLSRRSSRHKA